jgi:hypothetical protein
MELRRQNAYYKASSTLMNLSPSPSKSHYHTRGCGKGVMALGVVKITCGVQQSLLHT